MSSRWLFPKEEIEKPVRPGGTSPRTALKLRAEVAKFIRQLGSIEYLDIPQLTIATATLYMHRFFLRRDFADHNREIVALAAILLAGKVEESPRKLKMILSKANQLIRKLEKEDMAYANSEECMRMREKVLIAERILLQTISFDLMVEHPYRYLKPFAMQVAVPAHLQALPDQERPQAILEFRQGIVQRAWNFVNDSFTTTLCLQYPAKAIATAASYLACRTLNIDAQATSDGKPFYEVMDVVPAQLEDIINQILDLYTNRPEINIKPPQQPAASSSPAPIQAASPSSSSPRQPKPSSSSSNSNPPPQEMPQLREYSPASPTSPTAARVPSSHPVTHGEYNGVSPGRGAHHQPRGPPPPRQYNPAPYPAPHGPQQHPGGYHPHHADHGRQQQHHYDHRRDDGYRGGPPSDRGDRDKDAGYRDGREYRDNRDHRDGRDNRDFRDRDRDYHRDNRPPQQQQQQQHQQHHHHHHQQQHPQQQYRDDRRGPAEHRGDRDFGRDPRGGWDRDGGDRRRSNGPTNNPGGNNDGPQRM
eukprot:TRINITY_DN2241_c0_g1_i1.p1 TRINITY_DN2241_c0_g1~~TRINITY_DN2241_c0_g1_i1.p1  ORF type:complete len:531 (-),score=88.09 TRINITY_DN2241_c0_g1_i1:57-1649(-)